MAGIAQPNDGCWVQLLDAAVLIWVRLAHPWCHHCAMLFLQSVAEVLACCKAVQMTTLNSCCASCLAPPPPVSVCISAALAILFVWQHCWASVQPLLDTEAGEQTSQPAVLTDTPQTGPGQGVGMGCHLGCSPWWCAARPALSA